METATNNNATTQNVSFIDANGRKANIKITINNGRLSMSGDNGQEQDTIKPRTESQIRLIEIWKAYHLNDMQPGTPKQMKIVKKCKTHEEAIEKLTAKNLLIDKHPTTGEPYKYGSAWLTLELPEDLQEEIDGLIELIEEEEENRKGEPIQYNDDNELIEIIENNTDFSGEDATLCAALVKMFDLTINDLEDVEIDGTRVTVQGIDYLAGDDEQMDAEWDEYLENYIDECILPEVNENYRKYFDNEAWKDDAKGDGRAHSLNSYDGTEEEAKINDTYYFAYRQ